ncbi:MAG: hypothetical protein AVDCRST_MAG14-364, partial [uncultured Rubrobacteraceae bacterium]
WSSVTPSTRSSASRTESSSSWTVSWTASGARRSSSPGRSGSEPDGSWRVSC